MENESNGLVKVNQKRFHFDNVYMDNPQLYESIILYQIGDLSCESGYKISEHRQICYEISYIVSGEGFYFSDGRKYRVKKGDIYLNLPGEIHQGIADNVDPFRYFYIGFNFHDKQNELNPFNHIMKMFNQIKSPVKADRFNIQVPFTNIFNELINLGDFANVMIKAYIHEIVVIAYRNYFESWEKQYTPQAHSEKTKQIVYDIINFIDVNMSKIVDLSVIAEQLGYNYAYLSRIFSHETGFSIQGYYNRRRFEKAAVMLKSSEYNVTQIAESLQYQSIHSFSKAFRKNFGISPTQYQALYRK